VVGYVKLEEKICLGTSIMLSVISSELGITLIYAWIIVYFWI